MQAGSEAKWLHTGSELAAAVAIIIIIIFANLIGENDISSLFLTNVSFFFSDSAGN